MKASILSVACICLCSCGMYQSHFDCPPGRGVGCKPVSEVLDLIVEKEEGEDLFVSDSGQALLLKERHKKKRLQKIPVEQKKLYLLKERSGDSVLVEAIEKQRGFL